MKAALLRPLYPAVGGFASVYAETEDTAEQVLKRWHAARDELAQAGVREPTLDAIELVLTDSDLPAPAHAIFARDGRVVGTIALRGGYAGTVAEFSPLPQLRQALANAPLFESRSGVKQLRAIAGVEAGERSAVLTAVTDAGALRLARDELRVRLAELTDRSRCADRDRRRVQVAQGVAETLAALRAGRVQAVFLGNDPALAKPTWIGPAGTELAATRAKLAETGLLAPLRERTDEAIIRAAASNDAELFMLTAGVGSAPALVEGVAATLRHPSPMS